MFKDHPKGLYVLFFTEMWERFGFYTVLSIFVLYLAQNFHWSEATIGNIYGLFLAAVFFLPLFGGWIADNILGYGRTILLGAFTSAVGYTLLAIPTKSPVLLFTSLIVISMGNGLFKANTYVIVGNLYPEASGSLKDAAFNIFYMGINLGAFLAPLAASSIKDFMMSEYHMSLVHAYNAAFGASAVGMLIAITIFTSFRKYYKMADYRSKDRTKGEGDAKPLTKAEEKERITSLLIIFAVVIFFWMAYYQNGYTLTFFAKNYTMAAVDRFTYLLFDPLSLISVLTLLLGLSAVIRKASTQKSRMTGGLFSLAALTVMIYKVGSFAPANPISPESFQAFNPLFIIFLTPIVVAMFGYMNRKKIEPSSPEKMGLGMVAESLSFIIMIFAAIGLPAIAIASTSLYSHVTPYWLISSYFMITVAELLLSPMGLSFVSKVAPERMKGAMMGAWFAAQAIGSYLSGFVGRFYAEWQLWQFFLLFVCTSLVGGAVIFMFMKRLKKVSAAVS